MESKLLQIKTNCKTEDAGEEPVSPFGQIISNKTLSLSVIVVLEFEIPIEDSLPIKDLLREILLPVNPRFSSIMVLDKNGVQHWKRMEVNLEEHIIIPSFPTDLSKEAYDDLFNEYLTKITMDELPQERPLWEIHIIKYATTKATSHCIFKFHHAMGDGYSLMSVLFSCFKRADNPSLPLALPSLRRRSNDNGSRWRFFSIMYNTACDLKLNLLKYFVADDMTPIRSGNRVVHGMQISTAAFSLDIIKQIKTKLGGTVNDVIVSIVFLGIRLYMREISPVFGNSSCTALAVLNARIIDTYISNDEIPRTDSNSNWGNRAVFLHFPISALSSDKSVNSFDLLTEIHKMTNQKKNSVAVYLVYYVLELLRKFGGPEAGAKFMHRISHKASMALTSMIGPMQKMSFADHPVKGLYFAATGLPMSLVVTNISYMDTLRIGVGVEKHFIDSQKLISCMENAFDLICKDCLKNARD